MRRSLMLALVVALAALVFAPAAFAQDDNPTGDDFGGDDRGSERGYDDNPSRDDLGAHDSCRNRTFDDNPTGDDVMTTPTSSATSTASATPRASVKPDIAASPSTDAGMLPDTGGVHLLSVAAEVLLIGSGIMVIRLMRRTS
jgi:hypothetical protein